MNAFIGHQPEKTCSKCGASQPADLKHFYAAATTEDGLNCKCKRCVREESKERKRARRGVLRLIHSTPGFPSTRADCEFGVRPCPWATCRYHLPGTSGETCALDVASGGETLSTWAVAEHMGMTHQRVTQIEETALRKLAQVTRSKMLREFV